MQLDLFELQKQDYSKEIRLSIYKKVEHYGIDDYYRKNIKGKSMVLWQIEEKLSRINGYGKYMQILINELKAIVPVIPYMESFEGRSPALLQHDGGRYAYRAGNTISGPFYCLEMIPDEFFGSESDE